jgi:hypothetical protein
VDSDSDSDGFDTLEDFLKEGGGAGGPGTIGVVTEAEIAAMAAAGLPVSPASTSAGRAGTNNKGKGKGKGKEVEGKGSASADSEDGPRVLPKVIVLVPTQELVYQVLEVVKVVQPQLGSLVQVCIGRASDTRICQVVARKHDHRNTLLASRPPPPHMHTFEHGSPHSSPRVTEHRTPPPSPRTHFWSPLFVYFAPGPGKLGRPFFAHVFPPPIAPLRLRFFKPPAVTCFFVCRCPVAALFLFCLLSCLPSLWRAGSGGEAWALAEGLLQCAGGHTRCLEGQRQVCGPLGGHHCRTLLLHLAAIDRS